MTEERRKALPCVPPCNELVKLSANFDDFLERYERNQDDTNKWRDEMTLDIKNINRFFDKLDTPYKVFVWLVVAGVASVITGLGYFVAEEIKKSWR